MNGFDFQVLMATSLAPRVFADTRGIFCGEIGHFGRKAFGPDWGGCKLISSQGDYYYPLVSLALGRLREQGLVARRTNAFNDSQAGMWALTEAGKQLVAPFHAQEAP